jgi:hypothetical protein
VRDVAITSKQLLTALQEACDFSGPDALERAARLVERANERQLNNELVAKSLSIAIEPSQRVGYERQDALLALSHKLLQLSEHGPTLSAVALIAFYSGTDVYHPRSECALKALAVLPSPVPDYLLPKIEGYMKTIAEHQQGVEFTAYNELQYDISISFPKRLEQPQTPEPPPPNPFLDKIISFGEHLGSLFFSSSQDAAGLKTQLGLLNAEPLAKEYPWLFEVALMTLSYDRGDETRPLRATVAQEMLEKNFPSHRR